MEADIFVHYGSQESGFAYHVEAIPIRIEGYEFMELFMYQGDGGYGIGSFESHIIDSKQCKGKWVIAERNTGTSIIDPCENPEEAYFRAKEKLDKHGISKVRRIIDSAFEKKVGLLTPQNKRDEDIDGGRE